MVHNIIIFLGLHIYPTKWLPKNLTNFKTKEIKLFIVEYK